MRGDWRKSYSYLSSLSAWNLIPAKDSVLAMLKAKLQEEGLRTYLLAYGAFYKSLSLDQLCNMFDLPEKEVRCACLGTRAEMGPLFTSRSCASIPHKRCGFHHWCLSGISCRLLLWFSVAARDKRQWHVFHFMYAFWLQQERRGTSRCSFL
jgi:hypothetical protein